MSRTSEIRRVAAEVYDKDEHTDADLLFLEEIAIADRWCNKQLSQSNIVFGPKSEAHQRTKNGVAAIREARYIEAINRYQAGENVIQFRQAAE